MSVEASEKTQFEKPLIVGTTSGYAPYTSLNDAGEYEGFDIDMAKEVAKKLQRKLVIKDLGGLQPLFLSLKQKKIDMILFAVSITAERMQKMQMIHYQGEDVTELPLLFWKQIPEGISSLEDLIAKKAGTLCVEAGSYQERCAEAFGVEKLKQVDSIQNALLEIKYGKSIATLIDPSMLPKLLKQCNELKVVQVPLPENEQAFGNGICISKENRELAQEASQAIEDLKNEGVIKGLEEKWGLK